MTHPGWLFAVIVPTIWAITCIVAFQYPGDEYGLWSGAALPGLWLPILVPVGDIKHILWFTIPAGVLVMAALGAALDRLRSSFRAWYAIWVIAAGLLCFWNLSEYPTWSRAMAKNGSFQAYALSALNVGLLFATVVVIAGTAIWRVTLWAIDGGRAHFKIPLRSTAPAIP
ncbi:MAG: hypothetical protein WBC44_04965 [Planctomycetaceae bacterium]